MTRKTVLLADDQLFIMQDTIDELKKSYDVETASSGNEALEMIQKRVLDAGLDAIILDRSMPPGPDGDEIAKWVREQYPHIPVILQSSEHSQYFYLERIGVRVMNKFDSAGILASVKQILGEQIREHGARKSTLGKNAFGGERYNIQELLYYPSVGKYIQNTLESVLSSVGVPDSAEATQKILECARNYDPHSLEEYERAAHAILMDCDAVTKIPPSLRERASKVYEQIRTYVRGKYVLDLGCGDGAIGTLIARDGLNQAVTLVDVTDATLVDVTLTEVYQNKDLRFLNSITSKYIKSIKAPNAPEPNFLANINFLVENDRRYTKSVPFYLLHPDKPLPFSSEVFDTTLLLTVLHHCDDPIKTLQEAQRVTKHGGQIIVIESVYGVQDETAYGRLAAEEQLQVNIFFDHFYNRVLHYSADQELKVNVPFNFNTTEGWKREFEKLGLQQREVISLGIDQPTVPEYHTLHILENG